MLAASVATEVVLLGKIR